MIDTGETPERAWWKEAVVYQIYPRSFNDSDGDGVGDIPGITERVDYLDDLDIDVVWLCPVYDSPDADNGYDIRDYRAIGEEFGTMADWEELRDALHARDIRLVMDLVVNHTSDEHEWFGRSRREEGEYADYYHWREGRPDEPPNNWTSFIGGSAWSWDTEREAWYLHLFDEKQPDLNWRNPAVREEVHDLTRWWLEKGIDGFRLDAINLLSKAEGLPDGDPSDQPVGGEHFFHGPELQPYLRELYDEVLSEYDVMTVAEMDRTDPDLAAEILGEDGTGMNMIFQFDHMSIDVSERSRWDPDGWGEWSLPEFKRVTSRWQTGLAGRGWNSVYLGNHDWPRMVSRFGSEAYREESAKLLGTYLLTMGGTPYLYQGDELGMTNVEFDSIEAFDDPMTVGAFGDLLEAGRVDSFEEVRGLFNHVSRDHSRTPMQWDDSEHAGFTDGDPWFPVNGDFETVNAEAEMADEGSVLAHYRRLIEVRNREETLVYGDFGLLLPDDERFYAYTRTLGDDRLLVVLNWSGEAATFAPEVDVGVPEGVLVSNHEASPADPTGATFRPYEAVVYRV
jgi:glycosidase